MPPDLAAVERRRGVLAIAGVTLLWGLNFVLASPVARAADPFAITFARALLASIAFVPVLLARGGRALLTGANLRAAFPLAVACVLLNQVFFLLAVRTTTPTHVALVVATLPVFVAVIARLALDERLAPLRVVGIAVALVGVVCLALQRDAGGTHHATAGGDLLALAAAVSFAAFTVANKALVARVGAFPATVLVYLDGALLLFPFALPALARGGWRGVGSRAWLSGAYLTVGATLVAYPLFSYALARLTASRVAVFTYLQPVLAATLSYAIGWERFSGGTLAAALLTIAGVVLAQKRAPS